MSKKTLQLLESMESKDSSRQQKNHLYDEADPIATLIYQENLRIKALHFHKDLDLMLIILNNAKVLKRKISHSKLLELASEEQLNDFEFIGKGTGIHWPSVDEDLSLHGFLLEEITQFSQFLTA